MLSKTGHVTCSEIRLCSFCNSFRLNNIFMLLPEHAYSLKILLCKVALKLLLGILLHIPGLSYPVSFLLSGYLCCRQVLHRQHSGSLPGKRNISGYALQSDHVFLSWTMSEEGSTVEGLPPPWPCLVEGGVQEETKWMEKIQSFRTFAATSCKANGVWVSVQVLRWMEGSELLWACSAIRLRHFWNE